MVVRLAGIVLGDNVVKLLAEFATHCVPPTDLGGGIGYRAVGEKQCRRGDGPEHGLRHLVSLP